MGQEQSKPGGSSLMAKLAQTKMVYRNRLRNRDKIIEELYSRLINAQNVERRLVLANYKLRKLENNLGVNALQSQIDHLKKSLQRERARTQRLESVLAQADRSFEREM